MMPSVSRANGVRIIIPRHPIDLVGKEFSY
jgi:hypothetical protein